MSLNLDEMFRLDVSALVLIVRTSIIYLGLLIALRVITRREMGSFELPDLLLLVLIVVEITDLVFDVDSIPAIFVITRDTFIVYTSNVFAILGLRSMYFLLAGVVDKFRYLRVGLALVLTFIGVKMLITALGVHIPTKFSLAFVALVLAGSVAASFLFPGDQEHKIEVDMPSDFDSSKK